MKTKKNYTYDLETFMNIFCGVWNHKGEELVFEISARRNNLDELIEFYTTDNIEYAIGFNNAKFDAQVMQYLVQNYPEFKTMQGSELVGKIYDFAQDLIRRMNAKEFSPYPEWKITVPQIDLYAMNHYDNQNKRTSLKWIEFSINFPQVQDLPYKFDRPVHSDNFDQIIAYCKNDVQATREFAEKNKDLIKLRIQQSQKFPDLRLLNKSDSSVGEAMFLHYMSESMGQKPQDLKKLRTQRSMIDVGEIILPYINFKTPGFQELLEWYQGSLWSPWKKLEKSVRFGGIDFDFGEGGIHASWNNRIFESDSEFDILDIDVTSYYPNLAIVNDFRPEHLGSAFSRVYKNMFEERGKYPKGSIENQSYKIILNGSYGKFGDEYSFLFDKKVMLEICVNGQLLIAMLCERLALMSDQVTIIQANTDGVTIRVPKSMRPGVQEICSRWEKMTSLQLEYAEYSKMVISNVNNYMALVSGSGKVKEKGALYVVDAEYHKNKSQRVVRIALQKYFFEGIPIVESISNHMNLEGMRWNEEKQKFDIKFHGIYDFCLGKKVQWNQEFVMLRGMSEETINQKVIRYYLTTDRARMMKKYSDGRIEAVSKGYRAELFQKYEALDDYKIDMNYYVNECYKVTTAFDGGNPKIGRQLGLFDLAE